MSLFIPLALIPAAPEHDIVAIAIRDNSRIITGASSGQCVLWKRSVSCDAEANIDSLQGFQPVALIDGHCCAVSTLLPCTFEWTPAIASTHDDGTICLYDPDDGRCLLRQPELLPGKATSAAVLPDERRLVYCGAPPCESSNPDMKVIIVVCDPGRFCGLVMIDCYTVEIQVQS